MTKLYGVPWEFIALESARDLDPPPAIKRGEDPGE